MISTFDEVREILGSPNANLEKKIYRYLNPRMVRFIEHSPLVFISTIDSEGFPTISPKGDHPGFVKVEGTSTLYLPERKGNKLAFSFQNILQGSKAALLFIVPGTHEVLRVQGGCELLNDTEINRQLASHSHDALLVNRFTVDTCYFHCGKALLRSQLFSPDLVLEDMQISFGLELSDNGGFDRCEADAFDLGVKGRYRTDL